MLQDEITRLISLFSSFPTIGKKTATRIVLDIISEKSQIIPKFITALDDLQNNIKNCDICHNIDITNPCRICTSNKKQTDVICIVESIEDLWAIEKTAIFQGKYHVLGGVLSAVKGITPDNLNLTSLQKRINDNNINEIIIAINSNLDGQTTAYYLDDLLKNSVEKITKLGHGLPLGSELGYLDEGTINAAFMSRTKT